MKLEKLSDFSLNKENPFLKDSLEIINQNIVKKYKSDTKTGEKAILKAYDENTGEMLGHTQFIRQIEVDEDKFAKLYLSQFSAFWELKKSSIKVFGYILERLTPNKDEFLIIVDECMESLNMSKSSVYRGLTQLVKENIIARGRADKVYFINPMVAFNGSRITFAKTYIKKQKSESKKVVFEQETPITNPNQTNLLDQIEEMENE